MGEIFSAVGNTDANNLCQQCMYACAITPVLPVKYV